MKDIPELVKYAFGHLILAAMNGEDPAPRADDLRAKLQETFPGNDAEIDKMVDELLELLPVKNSEGGA